MTDPHETIAAITNLEQELHDLGWRPVQMIDEESGVAFTRWFPPNAPAIDRESITDLTDFPTGFDNGPHPQREDR